LDRAVRRVLVEGDKAFLKVSKVFAEIELKICRFENDRPGRRLRKLDEAAKHAGKLSRFPQSQVFNSL